MVKILPIPFPPLASTATVSQKPVTVSGAESGLSTSIREASDWLRGLTQTGSPESVVVIPILRPDSGSRVCVIPILHPEDATPSVGAGPSPAPQNVLLCAGSGAGRPSRRTLPRPLIVVSDLRKSKDQSLEDHLRDQFGEPITVVRIVRRLTLGLRGLGRVKMTFGPEPHKFGLHLYSRKGEKIGVIEHEVTEDADRPSRREAEPTWIQISPQARGRGLGRRLFVNSVLFFSSLRRFHHYEFFASDLGAAAWAGFGGLTVSKVKLAAVQSEIHRLNRLHDLGIPDQTIDSLVTFDQIQGLRWVGAIPRQLLADLDQAFRKYGSEVPPSRLRRFAHKIGRVALLNVRFVATIDLRRDSPGFRAFLASLKRPSRL